MAGNTPGTAHITAVADGVDTTIPIYVAPYPKSISINGPTAFSSQLGSVHFVTLTVTDANGKPIADIPITATSQSPIMNVPQGPTNTNAQGQATFEITSGGQVGSTELFVSSANGQYNCQFNISFT